MSAVACKDMRSESGKGGVNVGVWLGRELAAKVAGDVAKTGRAPGWVVARILSKHYGLRFTRRKWTRQEGQWGD